MDHDRLRHNGLTFFVRNREEFQAIYQEIFHDEIYAFSCSSPTPFIIDCGSHIGLSIAYFKQRFPQSEILAFEPDPLNYVLLTRMITANAFTRIMVINKALAPQADYAPLYGDFDNPSPQTCGHSLMQDWGQSRLQSMRMVETTPLYPYITKHVNYLKMDIEGAEHMLLPTIGERWMHIQQMALEFHGTGEAAPHVLTQVEHFLTTVGFTVQHRIKKVDDIFPDSLATWMHTVQPYLAIIHAVRSDIV